MTEPIQVGEEEVDRLYKRLDREAEAGGYHLNPDVEQTRDLIRGLLVNEKRYGYWNCPCRLSSGDKARDLDIICPCDYRDADIDEYNACYCALYVSTPAKLGQVPIGSIPERRPPEESERRKQPSAPQPPSNPALPVWRCRVCGYLCARDAPPEICPVCRAKRERFERFW